jgi:hypothetical protein
VKKHLKSGICEALTELKRKGEVMQINQIVKRLGVLESELTNGVAEYIDMLDEYLELYDELKEKEK